MDRNRNDIKRRALDLPISFHDLSLLGASPKEAVSGVEIEVESPTLEDTTIVTEVGERLQNMEEISERTDSVPGQISETDQNQQVSLSSHSKAGSPGKKSKTVPDDRDSVLSSPETESPGKKSETVSDHKDSASTHHETELTDRKSLAEPVLTPNTRLSPDQVHALEVEDHHNKQNDEKTSPTLTVDRLSSIGSPRDNSSQLDQSATEEITTESHEDGTNRKSSASPSITLDESTTKKEASEHAEALSEPKSASVESDESETTDGTAAKSQPKPQSSEASRTPENPTSTSQKAETLNTSTKNRGVVARPDSESSSEYESTSAETQSHMHNSARNGSVLTKVDM